MFQFLQHPPCELDSSCVTSITLPPALPRCPVAVPCLLPAGSTLGSFLAVSILTINRLALLGA